MKRPTDRRTVLMAAGFAAVAAAAGPAASQSAAVSGTVTFAGDAVVPKGDLAIYLEDHTTPETARRRVADIRIKSDGGSKAIAFSMSAPAGPTASSKLRIVARLERADGWLLARGSAQVGLGSPVQVTLNTVVY